MSQWFSEGFLAVSCWSPGVSWAFWGTWCFVLLLVVSRSPKFPSVLVVVVVTLALVVYHCEGIYAGGIVFWKCISTLEARQAFQQSRH